MPEDESASLSRAMRVLWFLAPLALLSGTAIARAQATPESSYYARANSFGIFSAYSGDSSHMLLGRAENRMLLDIGVSYGRKLFLNRVVNWQYNGELLPVTMESDPLTRSVNVQTSPTTATYIVAGLSPLVICSPVVNVYSYTINGTTNVSGTDTLTCSGRRWTIGEAISPVGMQWNFLTRKKLQPYLIGHGGYMYSTRPVPTINDGSFNFTFDLGAGLELYRSRTKSIRAEYRYHHISNHNTANQNPGIDNGLFQVTYCFGR